MKAREITIDNDNLDLNYDSTLTIDLVKDYVTLDLEVPSSCIKSLKLHVHYVDIQLNSQENYFNDDLYVNLQRVS
ncbi:hypothetical protein [Sulfurimonas sp.]|uniref:hypothetical protein n=1 Tax=Sulfurimonas sp. TaxID=2022749 RepID=UPI0025E9B298|nr:hypothetical protein [Sulfurimonas sp.]MBT5934986.1 hypothetical protein [Sulfurimonas sp.]MBT7349825.1 hypothetical protein [candidate division WWE3 bacterium]